MQERPTPESLSALLRKRRSVRDFKPDRISLELLNAVLEDATCAPSWSNTQPYRIAIASGEVRDRISSKLCVNFDLAMKAQQGGLWGKLKMFATRRGLPDGDFATNFAYPMDLQPRRRATGVGLYEILEIERNDRSARNLQMRKNFEFFNAPTALFIFVHKGLHEFSVLDAGVFLQTIMLSAQARGLATCAQGALATWAGPVREEFLIPHQYKLICGLAIGYASSQPVNLYDPGRASAHELLVDPRPADI